MPDLRIQHTLPGEIQNRLMEEAGRLREQDPEHQKLRKATREFEGYFVGLLLKQMHAAAVRGGLFGQNSAAKIYREMFDEILAAEIGQRGAFGIGDMLYKELAAHLNRSKP